jgi:hypothetical protein
VIAGLIGPFDQVGGEHFTLRTGHPRSAPEENYFSEELRSGSPSKRIKNELITVSFHITEEVVDRFLSLNETVATFTAVKYAAQMMQLPLGLPGGQKRRRFSLRTEAPMA